MLGIQVPRGGGSSGHLKKGGKDTSGDRDRKGKGKYMGVMIWGHKKRGKSVSVRSSSQLELTTEAGYLQK